MIVILVLTAVGVFAFIPALVDPCGIVTQCRGRTRALPRLGARPGVARGHGRLCRARRFPALEPRAGRARQAGQQVPDSIPGPEGTHALEGDLAYLDRLGMAGYRIADLAPKKWTGSGRHALHVGR
jgi:hypothetical protein